jgi:hypothetical protein
MTKAEFKSKYKELVDKSFDDLSGYCEKALKSGSINLESFDDDFLLPKLVLLAALRNCFDQWKPQDRKLLEEYLNIYTCTCTYA